MRPPAPENLVRRFAAVHNRREGLAVKARSANQRAIELFLSNQAMNIVGSDAAAVQNPQGLGLLGGKFSLRALPEKTVYRCGNFRRCRLTRANCPDWLVSYQNTGELFGGQRAGAPGKLSLANLFRASGFSVLQQFADANDGSQSRGKRSFRLFRHIFAGLAEKLPPLGITHDHVAASRIHQPRRNLLPARLTLFFP